MFSNVNIFFFIMIGNKKMLKQIEIIRKNKEIKIKKGKKIRLKNKVRNN